MKHRTCLGLTVLAGLLSSLAADDAADQAAALARMPAPWKQPAPRFSAAEYAGTLRYWAETHPDCCVLSERGRSDDGYPIYLLDLTDRSAPDDEKQRVVVTGLHQGPERSGATTILRFVEWLLSQDPEARETLKRQRVLVMPIVNPHGFFAVESNGNAAGLPVYDGQRGKMFDIPALKLLQPEKTPELRAFLGVIDEFQPEVHADIHGISLSFPGQLVYETAGSAGSNHALRPWDARLPDAMIAAAREAGYPSDRWEADAQRMLWGPELEPHAAKLWMGRVFFYPATYAYMRYHTLPVLTENGWEEGGVARLRGLLRVGNSRSELQPDPGYAVNRMKMIGGHFLATYGGSAAARRKSRFELWNRQGAVALGMLYPQCDCRALFACAVTPEAQAALSPTGAKNPALTASEFVRRMKSRPDMKGDAIEAFVRAGPETKLYLDPATEPASGQGLDHGLTILLRLAYAKPELLDVRLNGHRVPVSETDGYQVWCGDGYTHLQFNIPPETSRVSGLFLASVAYKPEVQRSYGWQPPAEVLKRIKP